LGDGLPAAGNFKPDIHFDGYELDTMQFPHDAAHHYMHLIDEAVVAKADSVVRSSGPDVLHGYIWNIQMIWGICMAPAIYLNRPYHI